MICFRLKKFPADAKMRGADAMWIKPCLFFSLKRKLFRISRMCWCLPALTVHRFSQGSTSGFNTFGNNNILGSFFTDQLKNIQASFPSRGSSSFPSRGSSSFPSRGSSSSSLRGSSSSSSGDRDGGSDSSDDWAAAATEAATALVGRCPPGTWTAAPIARKTELRPRLKLRRLSSQCSGLGGTA